MKKGYKGLAITLAMSMSMSAAMPAFASEVETVENPDGTTSVISTEMNSTENEDGSLTTKITVTEEISGQKQDGTAVEGTIEKVDENKVNADGELESESWFESGEIKEESEKPYDGEEDDVKAELSEGETTTSKGSASESKETTTYDEEIGADVTTKVTETSREVTTTTDKVDVKYDNNADAYEGEENLEFMTPVWDGTQVNLGGGTLDWFPGNSMEQKPEGYDYTPYGFMHNDVTHMWYIHANEDGEMVDFDGRPVYWYDKETDTYTRKLPDEAEIYYIYYSEKLADPYYLYYETENGFEAIKDKAALENVLNNGNSMMIAIYNASVTHPDEVWNAVEDELKELIELRSNASAFKKAANEFRTNHPEFYEILDVEKLVEDYQDGEVSQETTDLYNTIFELFQKNITDKKFQAPENIIPAYCVDLNTSTIRGSWYDLMNMEDVGYYSTERNEENGYISDADRIKAIAINGYWGTKEGKGSLEAMKAFFTEKLEEATANGEVLPFTQEDIDALTHGCALTITQHSIWRFGNSLENAYMDGKTYAYGNENARDARIDKFIEYFTTMPIDTEVFDESEIITQEKFVDTMTVTVGNRADNHANNQDDNADNDAYNVDFNFSLVVAPGENDDLVVSIINNNGEIIAKARLAGDGSADDDSFTGNLVNDGNGNYRFTGLTLIENSNQTFSLNLEGVQYLEEGVYLFKSAGGEEYSQTMVTLAEGAKAVDLAVAVDFSFDVKEGSVTETRTWTKSGSEIYEEDEVTGDDANTDESEEETETPEEFYTPDSGEDVYEEIDDPEVPLADAPQTGSNTLMYLVMSAISGAGLAVTSIFNRKKNDEE